MLVVKNMPASAGDLRDPGWILGWEDPLGEGTATHSSILGWRIPWTEEPGRRLSMGSAKSWTQLNDYHFHFHGSQWIGASNISRAPINQ